MEFLLNNPVIAFVLLSVLGLTIFTVKKIVNEIGLNKDLKIKQASMRVTSNVTGGFGKRMSLLGAQAIAPIAIVAIAFVAGINAQSPEPTREYHTIQSASEILDLYDSFQERYTSGYVRNGFMDFDTLEMAPEAAMDDVSGEPKSTGSDDYSETNNQVVGVDEMDNVLTDGKYIYTMYNNEVQITLAYTLEQGPEVLELVKTIVYSNDYCSGDQFYPMGMFVDEDRLIVIGNQYSYNCEPQTNGDEEKGDLEPFMDYYWGGHSSHVKILVYDKSDDFTLEDEYKMNGYFTGTRKIEDSLYIVTNNYIPFYLEDINLDSYLPYISVNDIETKAAYEDISYVDGTNPNAFTTFYGIDLESNDVDMEVVLGDSGFNLYVSNENIYLVGSVYYFWPLAEVVDVENPIQEYKTAIMRVAINDATVEFDGIGYIDGFTLNQFSMDEFEGNLRVTTTSGWWGEDINNRLWVLDEDMKVLSVLENLGKPGETIKSTRFVGEYAYLVTFEQTDPFYVINLSDPENPVTEGILEIPGFSTYLQPLSEDYMLGIGFSADDEGRVDGLKVAIYDITDKSKPSVFDEVIFEYESFGWGWSSATYNHKDLLVSLSKGLIALPFSTWGYNEVTGDYTYNSGIVVLKFDLENGFEMKTLGEEEQVDHEFVVHEENANWDCYVYKAKFISDYLYTISNKYIKVSPISDTEDIQYSVQLREFEAQTDPYGEAEAID